jgi:hypothetical protein
MSPTLTSIFDAVPILGTVWEAEPGKSPGSSERTVQHGALTSEDLSALVGSISAAGIDPESVVFGRQAMAIRLSAGPMFSYRKAAGFFRTMDTGQRFRTPGPQ